jgi:hypothetical protein
MALACAPVLAQTPADKPLTEGELLKQIETLNPIKAGAAGSPAATPGATPSPSSVTIPNSLILSTPGAPAPKPLDRSNILAPGATGPEAQPADPDAKPPTEITATEATFDQKGNVAVFLINVFVKDPQFTVQCDKLTAFLKHEDATAPTGPKAAGGPNASPAPKGAATPKPAVATPAAATPKAGTPQPGAKPGTPAPAGAVKKKTGLDKAIAVTTSERRVIIIQDKVEADGSITHGIGLADRAEYFASNGDIFLYGMPDVTQGTNRCIATAPETWMKLNRDGRMEAHGPHRTIIVDTSDRDNPSASK